MSPVLPGLDVLENDDCKTLKGCRLGLVANQASLDLQLRTAEAVLSALLPGGLTALFGPQHGHGGEDQDNMVETEHAYDARLQIPIFSLYARTREPAPHMLDLIDVLLIDLQDVGTRVYTFSSTMLACLRAAARAGKKVVVLDRPNPLGGESVEGNLLQPELYSFVGPCALPMRHGLTMGEMARVFNHVFDLGCDLEVIAVKGWHRSMIWEDTGLRWIMPSPNMPLPETARVYPGQVLWEGTNISEGRGTCRPFEMFGAPFLDTSAILGGLGAVEKEGCVLQEITFRPTFHKWQGQLCKGFMIHVTNPMTYRSYALSLALLKEILKHHREAFLWKEPPYEYEYDRMPIDLILGDADLRERLDKEEISEQLWSHELENYLEWRKPFLLYE